MTELSKTKWSVNSMVTVMIDNCMSFGDLQKMRQALTLEYSRDHDRFMHPVWVTASCDAHLVRPRFLRAPEPIPPVYLIKEEFRKFQSELKIEISEDGKVASHSFMQKVIELHEQHEAAGMLLEGVGETSDNRHLITYSFDAFPCKGISVEHAVIFSASLKVETQSEQLCKILCAGAIKENNEGINRMHSNRKVNDEFNLLVTRGYAIGTRGQKIWVKLLIACDKKAVEMFVGCSPGSPWCQCTKEERLATAWDPAKPPTTWAQAEAALKKVCKHAFPDIFDILSSAHLALPMEKLPRKCKFCNKKPYETEAQYQDSLKKYAERRADTSKAGINAFKTERSNHSGAKFWAAGP